MTVHFRTLNRPVWPKTVHFRLKPASWLLLAQYFISDAVGFDCFQKYCFLILFTLVYDSYRFENLRDFGVMNSFFGRLGFIRLAKIHST